MILKFDGQPIDNMRSLPRAVAATAIGKSVPVELLRKGQTMDFCGRPSGGCPRTRRSSDAVKSEAEEPAPEPEREDLLGLSIAPLTDELREPLRHRQVDRGRGHHRGQAEQPAAQKEVKPGDVIVEVTQEKVKQPQDVKARLLAVKKSGRRSVLLLLSDAKGELRFVAVPTS